MSSPSSVKQYLACWFQLGKRVVANNGQKTIAPGTVLRGNGYSQDFEECWQYLQSSESGDCYLEGTHETIADLMSDRWEITECGRCDMPIPMRSKGIPAECCPCHDLPSWPNNSLPLPRVPVNTQSYLRDLNDRLLEKARSQRNGDRQEELPLCWRESLTRSR